MENAGDNPLSLDRALQLGIQHQQKGNLPAAEAIYRQILSRQPRHADALHLLGTLQIQLGHPDAAIELIHRAIAIRPDVAEYHSNLSAALRQKGRLDEAIESCNQSLRLQPEYPDAYFNLSVAQFDQRRFPEAIASARQVLRLRPDFVEALSILGDALYMTGQPEQAIAAYQKALQIRPNAASLHLKVGNIYRETERLDEALTAYSLAIQSRPDWADAHNNLANVLADKGRIDDAIAVYRRAIHLNPNFVDAHLNLSSKLLLQGDFQNGWQEYEWRLRAKGTSLISAQFPQPRWDGRDLNGQTILLHAEQGIGDFIQFVRYVPLVARRGGKNLLLCPPAVVPLMKNFPGIERILTDPPFPHFDTHCPLASLPMAFQSSLDSIPASIPYLFPDADAVQTWRQKLGPPGKELRVGLVWAGNPAFKGDRTRSLTLQKISPIVSVPNVRFFSLQKGTPSEQTRQPPHGIFLTDLAPDLHTLADTAAVMSLLDLIITTDTSIPHLAGALGRPVWLMLQFLPDFRWLLHRQDSPWYPTICLFRQPSPGDWDEVIRQVAVALADYRR